MTGWETIIDAIPARPTKRGFLWSLPGEYASPARLSGRSLEDVASAYGRPAWYLDEPATGGLVAGWARRRSWAARFSRDGVCTEVVERLPHELELSWRVRILGNVRQQPMTQVVRWLGPPNSRSSGHRYTLLQWQCPGLHIALRFGADGRCTGITHKYARNPVSP